MIIAVISLGSKGYRRLRIMQNRAKKHELHGIVTLQDRRVQVEGEFVKPTHETLDVLSSRGIEVVFVCAAPNARAAIFGQIDLEHCQTFSELDLIASGYGCLSVAEKQGTRRHYFSSTTLYDQDAYAIAAEMRGNNRFAFRYHVGQYYPDWHPWERYQDFLIGKKGTKGIREILGIELPWLETCFGKIVDFQSSARQITSLEIDFPGVLRIIFTHEAGVQGQLMLDVVTPKPAHDLDVFGDLKPQTVYFPFHSHANPDHWLASHAAFDSTKSFPNPTIWRVLMMESVSETEFSVPLPSTAFLPNVYVDISEKLEEKLRIVCFFKSEIGSAPFPRSPGNPEGPCGLSWLGCRDQVCGGVHVA